MSEEQGESVETPDDEPGDADDESAAPGSRGAAAPGAEPDEEGAAAPGAEPDEEGPEASIDLDDLEDLVEAHETETVAREIAGLRERVGELERELDEERAEREDLESRLKHKQAEFQNYKKRQSERRERERARATEDLVERLLEVRDNLARALEQDDDADIREGVEATFRQLDDVLRGENVDPIEPEPGAEIDPQRHEVLLTVDGDQPPGTVEEVHRPGYEMADKVLRTARVTVADGDSSAPGSGADADDGTGNGDGRAGEAASTDDEAGGDAAADVDGDADRENADGDDAPGGADAGGDGPGTDDADGDGPGTDDADGDDPGTDDVGDAESGEGIPSDVDDGDT